MKHILSLLTLMAALLLSVSPEAMAAKPASKIVFDGTTHDFGNIHEEKGPVTHVFEFTNNGDAPLVIISATASCGCTKPKYSPEPVRPGQKGKISVTYVPQNRPGEFDKTIKVRTNDPGNKRLSLRISGTVIPARKQP